MVLRDLPAFLMRYFQSAASLVLVCALGGTCSASATPSHKKHHLKHSAKTKELKVKAHHGVPVGQMEAHQANKQHKAMYKHAHPAAFNLHQSPAATESVNVAETILPVPMKNGRLFVPPPLVGSLASLERQNARDNAEGLSRIENDAQLNAMRREGELVPLPVSVSLRVNRELPANRRYTRPWTEKFLTELARAHYARFHRSLEVNSAVRTVAYQRYLTHVNGNAAPAVGETASPHETGATIDIGKKGLSLSEIAWMRAYLLPLETVGKVDVEEEFYQSCFHITVYKSYMPVRKPAQHNSTVLLAAGMR